MKRLIAKAISFRILSIITTMIVVYLITGNLGVSLYIAGTDSIIKIFLYIAHEKIWKKTKWLKKKK